VAKLNKSIASTLFQAVDGQKYRLRNLGYMEGGAAYNKNQ
jgi:hypothetical protein